LTNEADNKTTGQWMARLTSGDHRAFAEFVDKYKSSVFLCCRTLGLDANQAEDVAAETFLAAYKGLKKFRGDAKLGTWLWKIAYFKAISHIRKNDRTYELLENYQNIAGNENAPSQSLENRENQQIIYSAVEKLPKLWAFAVILYYREQKSVADIARIMRINENTAKTYLFRAKRKLKEILSPVFGDDYAG
jgi:RNA polymerase sigma factor (sigma-70 family)